MRRMIAVVVVSGTIAPASGRSVPVNTSAPTQCEQLAAVKLENTTILSAERITRGAFTPPGAQDSLANLPPFCRVTGEIRPTTDSHIAFEVWMPLENWSGKFVGVGNGGWAGVISYGALAEELRRGYATVSTNTGHVAEPGLDMAKFDASYKAKKGEAAVACVIEALSSLTFPSPGSYASKVSVTIE